MARKHNLYIDKGSTFEYAFDLNDEFELPLDVTGLSATAALKPFYTYGNTVSFTCTLETGKLTLSMSANTTASLTIPRYVYDVKLINTVANTVTHIVEGKVYVESKV